MLRSYRHASTLVTKLLAQCQTAALQSGTKEDEPVHVGFGIIRERTVLGWLDQAADEYAAVLSMQENAERIWM